MTDLERRRAELLLQRSKSGFDVSRLLTDGAEVACDVLSLLAERRQFKREMAALLGERERLEEALEAADILAASYAQYWTRDGHYYRYMGARAALAGAAATEEPDTRKYAQTGGPQTWKPGAAATEEKTP